MAKTEERRTAPNQPIMIHAYYRRKFRSQTSDNMER